MSPSSQRLSCGKYGHIARDCNTPATKRPRIKASGRGSLAHAETRWRNHFKSSKYPEHRADSNTMYPVLSCCVLSRICPVMSNDSCVRSETPSLRTGGWSGEWWRRHHSQGRGPRGRAPDLGSRQKGSARAEATGRMRPFPPLQPPPPPPRALGSRHLHVTVERSAEGFAFPAHAELPSSFEASKSKTHSPSLASFAR